MNLVKKKSAKALQVSDDPFSEVQATMKISIPIPEE
jgi:hypothetical protein